MMRFVKGLLVLAVGGVFMVGCQTDTSLEDRDTELRRLIASQSPTGSIEGMILPDSRDYAAIPQDPRNPITDEKVELGKLLFHETGIAVDPLRPENSLTYSCASCHHAAAGFQAGTVQGIGEGGIGFGASGEGRIADLATVDHDVQPVKSPTILNVAFQENMLWNGQFGATGVNVGTEEQWTVGTPKALNHLGYQGVEIQAIAGLGVHRLNADNDFIRSSEYRLLFEQAFPDIEADRRYTAEFVGLAIAAYERTVMANESRWQKYLRGNTFALDEVEKFGAELFFSKAECSGCHNGPALSAMEFKAIGMADLVDCPEPTLKTTADNVENLGRGGFTQREDELYQYKVPTIYNLKDSPFYGHGSSLRSIKAVIEYKNKAIPEKAETIDYLDNRFRPLGLTAEEVDALTRFVRDALYDSDLDRYLPDRLPSGLCFPNNDKLSKDDLGCS